MLSRKVILFFFATLLVTTQVLVVEAAPQATPAEMRETALLVGNVVPFGPTDGVLRYDGRGRLIDNMVPIGVAGIAIPCCMTFGPDENLYVSSPLESRVQRFNGVTGTFIDTFVPAGSGGLVIPLILLFHEGYLYVGDTGAGAIRRYDAKTGAYVDNFIPDNSQGMGSLATCSTSRSARTMISTSRRSSRTGCCTTTDAPAPLSGNSSPATPV